MKRLFACISLCFWATMGTAQTIAATQKYADYQMQLGNYELALENFSRLLFFQNDNPDFQTTVNIGICYAALDEFQLAEQFFKQAYFLARSLPEKNEVTIRLSQHYLMEGSYGLALENLLSETWGTDEELKKRINFYLGLSYFYLEDFTLAAQYFTLTDLDSANIHYHLIERKKHLQPNVDLVTVMSIALPGLGQAYLGNFESAINSFSLNALFWVITINSYGSIGFIEGLLVVAPWLQRYYVGGVYNARRMAQEKQKRNRDAVLQKILE